MESETQEVVCVVRVGEGLLQKPEQNGHLTVVLICIVKKNISLSLPYI